MLKTTGVRLIRDVLLAGAVSMLMIITLMTPVMAATTSLTIRKVAPDGNTVLAERTVDYKWLMDPSHVPVMGDGKTHYYHQGPVFMDHSDLETEKRLRWNPEEDTNIQDKDMGAVKGTNVRDLCELVGGMSHGDVLRIKAADGLSKKFAYQNVYRYSNREGPMVICWYQGGKYADSGYREGMRLVWFADTSSNPWKLHVFGNWDWHEAAKPEYWYFYQSADEEYPTTTGLSIQNVSELTIISAQNSAEAKGPLAGFIAAPTVGNTPLTVKFQDQSRNQPVNWAWDFDNDSRIDSTLEHPSYTFSVPGLYSVNLTVTNAAGSDQEIKRDYILVKPAASSPEMDGKEPAAGEGVIQGLSEVAQGQSDDAASSDNGSTFLLPVLLAAMLVVGLGLAILVRKRDS